MEGIQTREISQEKSGNRPTRAFHVSSIISCQNWEGPQKSSIHPSGGRGETEVKEGGMCPGHKGVVRGPLLPRVSQGLCSACPGCCKAV